MTGFQSSGEGVKRELLASEGETFARHIAMQLRANKIATTLTHLEQVCCDHFISSFTGSSRSSVENILIRIFFQVVVYQPHHSCR